jgi:hypothetical protein
MFAGINPLWIQRLNAFVAAAAQRDIVVEFTLFCFGTTNWIGSARRCIPPRVVEALWSIRAGSGL